MMRGKILILGAIVVLALGYLYVGYFSDIHKTGLSGIVSKRGEYWGIKSDTWYKNAQATVKNLPAEFQREGARVSCDATVVDVIGAGEWDVYTEVSNCKAQ